MRTLAPDADSRSQSRGVSVTAFRSTERCNLHPLLTLPVMPSLLSFLTVLPTMLAVYALELLSRAEITSCPGVDLTAVNDGISSSACCVGGTVDPVYLSVCDGWPIFDGPVNLRFPFVKEITTLTSMQRDHDNNHLYSPILRYSRRLHRPKLPR